jgi:hypothetical protein
MLTPGGRRTTLRIAHCRTPRARRTGFSHSAGVSLVYLAPALRCAPPQTHKDVSDDVLVVMTTVLAHLVSAEGVEANRLSCTLPQKLQSTSFHGHLSSAALGYPKARVRVGLGGGRPPQGYLLLPPHSRRIRWQRRAARAGLYGLCVVCTGRRESRRKTFGGGHTIRSAKRRVCRRRWQMR